MCSCIVGEAPDVFRVVSRRARKAHRCVECRKTIHAGETYEYASGVWDGASDSFKTCTRCVLLRKAHVEAEEHLQLVVAAAQGYASIDGCRPVFGELLANIGECARDDRRYVQFFRLVRRGEPLPPVVVHRRGADLMEG